MWTFDDASRLDMDSRTRCPTSYGVGFDACDPVGSVLELTGRGPARILRRRCRSEGVDRSPYEDASRELRSADGKPRTRALPNKSHFTLNSCEHDRFHHECSLPAQNGDFVMANAQNRFQSYQNGKTKFAKISPTRKSPTRPLLVTTLSNTKVEDKRLPKVEELLEKVDHQMMEVQAKQPLKSILNNPLPKSAPQGILKKPKNKPYPEPKSTIEGRRRQRASSESDNLYGGFRLGSPVPGYDSRLSYVSANTKRAKDNSGTGYSYGSAIASLSSAPRCKSPTYKSRCSCRETSNGHPEDIHMHILRTTAITNEIVEEPALVDLSRQGTPTPTCPAVSPALPVSSVTAVPSAKKAPKTKKKTKPKSPKSKKMKSTSKVDCSLIEEGDDAHSRSPSPDPQTDPWMMETDFLVQEIEKIEKLSPPPPAPAPVKEDENSVTKLSTKMNGAAVTKKNNSKDSPLHLPETISNCLRASLFPRVPPYLKFIGYEEPSPLKVPVPIQKHLKWKLTTITPLVVQKTLTNSGFKLVKSECDTAECPQEETVEWIGIWGKHMKSLMFRAIKDGQKMNHFPGTFQIGRKDRLWRNLQKLSNKYGVDEFGIMPKTYVLPHDMKLLKHDWQKYAANDERWIIKPPASARGTGIKVVSRWTQIPKKRPVVVQRYISKPYLINGNKFDMRLYVLVTSVHPLRIYLYKDGLARFASVKYNEDLTSLGDRYMHLTNYSINRLSKNYTPNEDFNSCEGHKWTLQSLFHYLKTEKHVDIDALWESMKDLIIKTIISGEASISSLTKANVTSRYNCYELFGIDVLLDEDLKPWLLEVNISPSLHSASPLDKHVKGPLVTTVLNIAQFQVPVRTNLDMLAKDKPHKLVPSYLKAGLTTAQFYQTPGKINQEMQSKNKPERLAGLPYDSRLYTMYLSKEERDKHIIYTNMEEREMYLRDILSTLTPDDVRHLLQAEDELTQARDMQRVFPTRHSHKYLAYLAGPRYYNRLFDAWEARYGADRRPGIDMLRSLCDIGYHLEVPPVPLKNDVDAPSPPPSERASVPSLASLEAASCASAPRVCGDAPPGAAPPGAAPHGVAPHGAAPHVATADPRA